MNLLLMALIACGGDTTQQEANTTEPQTENTAEDVVETVEAPETKEVAQKVEAQAETKTPAPDEETKETTDQTVINNEKNTTEE